MRNASASSPTLVPGWRMQSELNPHTAGSNGAVWMLLGPVNEEAAEFVQSTWNRYRLSDEHQLLVDHDGAPAAEVLARTAEALPQQRDGFRTEEHVPALVEHGERVVDGLDVVGRSHGAVRIRREVAAGVLHPVEVRHGRGCRVGSERRLEGAVLRERSRP